jgi:hypothetical protein
MKRTSSFFIFLLSFSTINFFGEEKIFKNESIVFKIPDGWVEKEPESGLVLQSDYYALVTNLENTNVKGQIIYVFASKKSIMGMSASDQGMMRIWGLDTLAIKLPFGQTEAKKKSTIKTQNKLRADYELWNGIDAVQVNCKSPMATIKPKKGNGMWILGFGEDKDAKQIEDDFMKILDSVE